MVEPVRILIVEDMPTDAELAEREIRKAFDLCVFELVDTQPDFLAALEIFQPDLIVTDYQMPQFNGLTALKLSLEHDPLIPVIILTGAINEDTAVACMKAGATDYVIKEHIKRLGQSALHALEEKKLHQERIQAEEALHLTRFTMDNVGDAVYWVDQNARIFDANNTASQMLGYSHEELTQMTLANIETEFLIEEWLGIWDYLKDVGKLTAEGDHLTKDHQIIPVEIVVNYLEFNGREIVCVVVRDIAKRKQAEAALQKSEERLRQAISVAHIGLFDNDQVNHELYLSPEFREMWGLSAEEHVNFPALFERIHPEDRETVEQAFLNALASARDGFFEIEYRVIHPEETIHWQTMRFQVLFEGEGAGKYPFRTIGAVLDITEVKLAEEAQATLAEQLRQSQKLESIGQLAGGIAHDFNNLLVPMMGYAEIGQMKLRPDNKVHDYLQKIRIAAERAASLTGQILAFSRRQMLEIELFNLNDIIISFQEMLRRLIGENIELQLFLAPAPCYVKADQTQIEQIILNLGVNARDAMPNGGQLILETDSVYLDESYARTHIDTQPGKYVMLSFSDTGVGMDSETQQHIFEPFFTTKERGKGTGLGLSTVFGIVKQHKGNIWVYSEPSKGTTFKIYLPRSEVRGEPDEIVTSELPTIYGTETVMVAEDEPMVRKLVQETLETYGYTVLNTENVAEAMEIVANYEDHIHLLLTDVIMPGMNGRELYEKMKAIRPDLKVLYMSGYTDNVIVHHGVLDEGVNFLQKPFTIRGLAKKIRSMLD